MLDAGCKILAVLGRHHILLLITTVVSDVFEHVHPNQLDFYTMFELAILLSVCHHNMYNTVISRDEAIKWMCMKQYLDETRNFAAKDDVLAYMM